MYPYLHVFFSALPLLALLRELLSFLLCSARALSCGLLRAVQLHLLQLQRISAGEHFLPGCFKLCQEASFTLLQS